MGTLMGFVEPKFFCDEEECAKVLAKEMGDLLRQRLSRRKRVYAAFSGGRTPRIVLPLLAAESDIDWGRVTVMLTDERWVSSNNVRSNERLVQKFFLDKGAKKVKFFGFWSRRKSREEICRNVGGILKKNIESLDLVYLGMGEDGHIASLFPCTSQSAFGSKDSYCVLGNSSTVPKNRISLSLSSLLKSRAIFLQLSGPTKRRVYEAALKAGPSPLLPVSLILWSRHPDLKIYIAK